MKWYPFSTLKYEEPLKGQRCWIMVNRDEITEAVYEGDRKWLFRDLRFKGADVYWWTYYRNPEDQLPYHQIKNPLIKYTYTIESEKHKGKTYYIIYVNELPGICTDCSSLDQGMEVIQKLIQCAESSC